MNKQQLAQKIWASANQMRSKIEPNEYKDYILGFIFYKYLSDKELKFLKENEYDSELLPTVTEDDEETVKYVQANLGYFISCENLFSTWLEMGNDFDVSNVRDALSAFNRLISRTHKNVFDKVFDTLQTGLSKLGDSSGSQTKAINGLLQLIKDIPMDGKQDYDVLGFIYEYLISMFAANAGKKAGEFYTPHEVSLLMSEIVANHLKDKETIKIYDPTSGSGSLLINIGKSVSKYIANENNIKYYAQELKLNTYNLTRMNLVMRGINPDNIVTRNGDTLEQDWPYFDDNDPVNTYDPLYVNAVVSNPPYSQAWDPTNKEHDSRYSRFGLAPKSKADYAFLLHDLFHLQPDGIMAIVLPHGVLFRGGEEGEIRKNLIEQNHIDAIIGLPANIFFGTGIPTIIMILRQERENTDVLIIDASKGFVKEGKNNKLRASDIKRITDTYINRENTDKYSRKISREEIRNNDYNLNIPRYIDSSEKAENWDIYASMFGGIPKTELEELNKYWSAFPNLKNDLFVDNGIPYVELAVSDIKNSIKNHKDVKEFYQKFKNSFDSLPDYLNTELIDNMLNLNIAHTEDKLCYNIFDRFNDIPIIDKYEAYQILDDEWVNISIDLEIIQTEGFNATKKVDPNLVLKKKAGKDEEFQDGWIGHIIPFELVQHTLLIEDYTALNNLKNQLAEIPSKYESLIESMSEDEKEICKDVLNEDCDTFVFKNISKKIKELNKDKSSEAVSAREILKQAEILSKSEKELKIQIKTDDALLQAKTKETIENLTDEEVFNLLFDKWIKPITEKLNNMPNLVIDNLTNQILALQNKYSSTYFEVENQIKETSKALSDMIDDLVGDEFDMKGLSELKSLLLGDL